MPDILHDFFIKASPGDVFAALIEPGRIDKWWTLECSGTPVLGGEYRLYFGDPWDWRARVSRFDAERAFEWEMTASMDDWIGTRVGFDPSAVVGGTKVRFYHRGWAEERALPHQQLLLGAIAPPVETLGGSGGGDAACGAARIVINQAPRS
ncbi:MAG: SRPBCC domain-containing protein [Flavobacteriales bacterium]|nr:SRPBCC domain-containing protein [Flavobacteriales bacterium]